MKTEVNLPQAFESGSLRLSPLQKLGDYEKNQALVCKGEDGVLYTVLSAGSHKDAQALLPLIGQAKDDPHTRLIESFWDLGHFFLVFPYREKRSLFLFWDAKKAAPEERENMARNIVSACLDAHVPYPLLCQLLSQKNLQISKDGEAYFCFDADLSGLCCDDGEKRCADLCAQLALELLDPKSMASLLLSRKLDRDGYTGLSELYHDLDEAGKALQEPTQCKEDTGKNPLLDPGMLSPILRKCALVLGSIALLSLLSQLLFGDVVWIRIFLPAFREIGLESLV